MCTHKYKENLICQHFGECLIGPKSSPFMLAGDSGLVTAVSMTVYGVLWLRLSFLCQTASVHPRYWDIFEPLNFEKGKFVLNMCST